ncbi:hypothetical protein CRG98_010258 [Punica granatum]|uniref:G-patch domain-containing protein n=1 Tax=Punica granatum TaxID=22663 RepID=A0A2I0KLG3_PUNGR|nr:hypothetical protein CRG98_010258 [Punica granatum]
MTTNMAELFALLRGPNRASSSSTPPSGRGPIIDPTSWIPPTQVPETTDAPAPPTMHTSTIHPFTSPFPPPPAPTAIPLPPAAFLSSEQALSAPPPVSMPAPAAVYTVPPPMVFPTSSAPAPTHLQAAELPPYPSLQPQDGLPYQAPPPINTTFLEPNTPTHAAQFASPTHFLPEVDAEQERRLKRMEETIRALQANEARPDARYGDCSLFPGIRLPSKVKIPEFRIYEGTTDPRHHLRHYQGKMLHYWGYEEFVIHSFQDSLSGSALDWFMSLKAEDIPTWADLSRKFTDQYQYCAETPPTLLELSMKEMTQGQKFEEYATKWRAKAAKHIPPISEVQQIQLFHSTLRGVYYSHLLAHTSSFSDLIEVGKKFDLGIKLGRMKGPTVKGEESAKRTSAMPASSKVSVNAVNPAHPTSQQYSINYTPLPPVVPAYTPPAPQYRPQPPSLVVHHYASTPPQAPQYRPASSGAPQSAQQDGESEQGGPSPFVIEYVPTEATVRWIGTSPTPFVIDIPTREPYSDDKVPWTYEGGVGNFERQFSVMAVTRSGQLYENPAAADKGKAPRSRSQGNTRSPAYSPKKVTEEEAEAFMKIIKAIMIDNGSALNVCPVTTLKQMNVDLNRVRPSKTAVRTFDGSRREVNGEIDLLIDVGPCSFNVTFQVLDIPNAFSLLLGRPWIHSTGAIPSSLHQKLKFIVEERLITVKGEEDYAIYKETAVPYISVGNDENLPFHSFETIFVIRDYGEIGPSRADRIIGKVLLRHNYIPGTGLGARGQGINRPIEVEEYKNRRGLGFRPSCHEIVEARRGNHLHRLAAHYGRLDRGIQVPPLSHFFPGAPHIIGNALYGPSSDSDDAPAAPPAMYAVTEEIPSGLHSNPNLRHVDSNPFEECLREPGPIYFGEGLDEDSQVLEI